MTDIFISYSRKDSEFMRYLHGELSRLERDVWVDWEDIPATADWWDEIKAAIEAADVFAFIISPDSVRSEICHQEIQHAIDNNKRFIPILYREVSDIDAPYVHAAIRSHNWIPFSDESQYESGLKKLIDSLSTEPEYVRRHTRLLVRAKEWQAQEREDSYLLVGDELKEFLKWLESSQTRTPKPTEIQLEYVYASQNRRNRRNLRIAAGAVAGFVLFIVLVAAYIIQQQQFTQTQHNQQSTSAAQNAVLTQEKQALKSTSAARNAILTQAQQQQAGTSAAQNALLTQAKIELDSNLTQVRDNSAAILTQGALEAENADLKSTIVAFADTATQAFAASPTASETEALTPTAESAENTGATQESSSETTSTEMFVTTTSDASSQQIVSTMPPMPTQATGEAVSPLPPSQTVEENKLYVGRNGDDNNDCRSPREDGCKTIAAALDKAEPGDTIDIAPGVYNENLLITKDVVLVGLDIDSTVISGNFEQTAITINTDANVEIYDLTITGGTSETYGGGIVNYGALYIENVRIEANSAQLAGGGIANFGELEAKDVDVAQNYAVTHHDIYSDPRAWAELTNVQYEKDNHSPLVLPQSESDDYLQLNMLVRIDTTDNENLNLRERPGLDAPIVAKITNGTLAIITQESEDHDGFTWWEVRLETGEGGWAADFVDDVQTIVPFDEYVDVEDTGS